ncbi:hypothetical protein PR003_g34512 [Phytophthora rubi]|uniref:Uncharacterized protein n=1 Tax=Phytophthora rubi TaxID=129364 RepID=A0A6A4AQS4_9STRA|nr:hypothetical protein PR002_g32751 [Phytophthora rubi]KAE9260100.1 hypothetical protein PR003_g34512 [Phytophthora rubi]
MDAGYAGDEDEKAGADVRGTLKYLEAAGRVISSGGELLPEHGEAITQSNSPRETQTKTAQTRARKTRADWHEETSSRCLKQQRGEQYGDSGRAPLLSSNRSAGWASGGTRRG